MEKYRVFSGFHRHVSVLIIKEFYWKEQQKRARILHPESWDCWCIHRLSVCDAVPHYQVCWYRSEKTASHPIFLSPLNNGNGLSSFLQFQQRSVLRSHTKNKEISTRLDIYVCVCVADWIWLRGAAHNGLTSADQISTLFDFMLSLYEEKHSILNPNLGCIIRFWSGPLHPSAGFCHNKRNAAVAPTSGSWVFQEMIPTLS